jgi:type II secretory pathway pseudopilin PulG
MIFGQSKPSLLMNAFFYDAVVEGSQRQQRSSSLPHQKLTRGIAYIGLLFTLTLMALALTRILPVLSQQRQREKEAELLWVGEQYQRAIISYHSQSPGTLKQYPKTISDLLEDRRFFGIKRHLRKPYPDPITGKNDWEIVKASDEGIQAIHSRSTDTPIKQDHFPVGFEQFKNTSRYSDWVFGEK